MAGMSKYIFLNNMIHKVSNKNVVKSFQLLEVMQRRSSW